MKKILFRGQRVDNKQWVYGYAVPNEEVDKWYILLDVLPDASYGEEETTLFATMWFEVIPETIGQYTGLKDKNGIEIFICDIVKCLEVTNTRTNEYISEIFVEDCDILVHDSPNSDTPLSIFFSHNEQIPLTEIEVIGNIYENPDLLIQPTTDN